MPRSAFYNPNGSLSPSLPLYSSSSAVKEKFQRSPCFTSIIIPLPCVRTRVRLAVINPRRFHYAAVSRFGRIKGSVISLFSFLLSILVLFSLFLRFGSHSKQWPTALFVRGPSLVFRREDLQRIWQWEIASGHYPSGFPIPEELRLRVLLRNPGIPPQPFGDFRQHTSESHPFIIHTRGIGSSRAYPDIKSDPPMTRYPPRPTPGSIADLDIVMKHCDFFAKKYVRDCLEVLRIGAGLDTERHHRRGKLDRWKYIYIENGTISSWSEEADAIISSTIPDSDPDAGLVKKQDVDWEKSPMALPPTVNPRPYHSLPGPCDPENPRIFHMFWTGPFTDKPYTALLSFLFTQNTGLHLKTPDPAVCRPKIWMWINPGPAASIPKLTATVETLSELETNPWASPFLHPRFKDVVQFRLWNTTEQLDSIPELRHEWRGKNLFNSLGSVIHIPDEDEGGDDEGEQKPPKKKNRDDLLTRTGSKSSDSYDRLSVILSDMVRFILCHRYGGTYLDADTIFLRDWEELWGWKGAYAYRWGRLKRYNTAVLHMNKGSALGSFIFRTALKNNMDFHPEIVSRYMKDALLEGLLLRLPDALFDPAWLNTHTEMKQRDRPAQPYFKDFKEFFETPKVDSAAPNAYGFDGFFKGAYSYHFHNFWWLPFDPARNWPDLGPKFITGERIARNTTHELPNDNDGDVEDRRDLDWATVLKRTFEAYIRGERPNMYGEWIRW